MIQESPVRPPTTAQVIPVPLTASMFAQLRAMTLLHCSCTCLEDASEHLLELLHRQATHRLRGRLRLENAWLLREGVDALPRLRGGLVFQLHVEHTGDLEVASLLHLFHNDTHIGIDDALHFFCLQTCCLGHRLHHAGLRNRPACLHRAGLHRLLHCLHGFHCFHCLHRCHVERLRDVGQS